MDCKWQITISGSSHKMTSKLVLRDKLLSLIPVQKMLEMLWLSRPVEAQWLVGCLWSSVSQQQMAVPAGQDGARRLRNGMMPLRPDWNTAWHIYVQKHTSHTVFWSCRETFILTRFTWSASSWTLKNQPLSEDIAAFPLWCHAQVTDSSNHFRKLRVKWHPNIGMAMEADGTLASPWSCLHFLILSGARVCLPVGYGSDGQLSLSRLLPGKPPFIWKLKGRPLGSLWKKLWISLIILSLTVSPLLCLAFQIACVTMWLVLPYAVIMLQYRQ